MWLVAEWVCMDYWDGPLLGGMESALLGVCHRGQPTHACDEGQGQLRPTVSIHQVAGQSIQGPMKGRLALQDSQI